MGLQVALQQQQEMMCEMKSSCPVPRGSVQHTEQGWGWGGGCRGRTAQGVPSLAWGQRGLAEGAASFLREKWEGALGMGLLSSCCGAGGCVGHSLARSSPHLLPCCDAPAPCTRHPLPARWFPAAPRR